MTDRLRTNPYAAYHQGEPAEASRSQEGGLGTKKTMLVLVVVVGCFAVLWPKLFYPMLVNNANSQMKPGPVDKTTGCCDVISELDLDTIKIMSELCGTIIDTTGITPPSPQEIVTQCRKAVLETCGIDLSAALQDRIVSLGHSVKQILEEVRSLNGSLCLKYNFGLSPWKLGVPHRVNINLDPLHSIRQERPTHLRSEMVHPAFKERGRAIPQPDASGILRRASAAPRIVEGRPGPIPGMRPAMGGPGHMVAPSKQSNYGFMGVLMPIYTIGFVVFFTYTIMKLAFKKKTEAHVGAPLYPPCDPDERFHKEVFEANKNYFHRPHRDSSKVVVNAVSALLEEVNQELEARKLKTSETVHEQDEIKANGSLPKEDEQGTVKVMGMVTTASCESGKKWTRPESPVLPHPHPIVPKEPSPPPQQIFLEGSLPPQSQILVADSATEAQKDPEDDSPVVLAGKMTLSVISLDSETGTEDSLNSGKKAETSDEERRTSSSNVSEEFEKINAADLEEQINNIIEEAENMSGLALTEENRYSLTEELDKFTEEIHKAPQINEKEKDNDVLEEIKNQLNLEDDLLLALKQKEPEGKVGLPVTDIIKEFLNNEDNALLEENKEIDIGDVGEEDLEVLERYKRSLSEEKHDEELPLHENLVENNETLNVINKEVDSSSATKKDDLEFLEKQQGLLFEEPAKTDLSNDKLDGEPISENKVLDVDNGDNTDSELPQKAREAAAETEESKVFKEELDSKIQENLMPDNDVLTEENSGLIQEGVDVESPQKEHQGLVSGSEEIHNLDTENEEINEENPCVIQKVDDVQSSSHQGSVSDSENIQKNLDTENEDMIVENPSLKQEVNNVEPKNDHQETVGDDEKTQQNLVIESKEINEENSISTREVESSESNHQDLVSKKEEENDIDTEIGNWEKTPEESKADLLLQGLMVREDEDINDQEDVASVALGDKSEDQKALNTLSSELLVEKDNTDVNKPQQAIEPKEDISSHSGEKRLVEDELNSGLERPTEENLQERLNEETSEEISEQNLVTGNINREDGNYRLLDEEGLIDDEDYDDDSEVRDINREIYETWRQPIDRVNGEEVDSSRNGTANSETAAENEISEDEDLENEDDDEEIEEIIEYVDNTDDEGEEVVEINGNEQIHLNENGAN